MRRLENRLTNTTSIFLELTVIVCVLGPGVVHAQTGKNILKATGVKGGLVVHIGCGDGRMTASLYANERYLVHGLACRC